MASPAVVGKFFEGSAVVGNIPKLKLLELLFVGIEGRTRVRGIHGAFALGLAAVSGKLIVGGRLNGGTAVIEDFSRHINAVMASVERVGLLDRYASLGCLKDHVELVGIPHAELLTDKLVLILMIREIATHKAALSNVGAILCEFKKIDIAKIFSRFSIKNEPCQAHFSPVSLTRNQRHFGTDDGGTLTVEGDLHAVGFNNDRIP